MSTLTIPARTPAAPAGSDKRASLREWLRHSGVMVRRILLSIKADPEELMDVTLFPVLMTALFTYVFGGAMKASVGGNYLEFLIPGIFTQMIVFGTLTTGVKLSNDFDKGVIDRFRSLPIARSAVLNGHFVATVLRLLLASLITFGAASAMGFRVQTSAGGFLAGLLVLMALSFGVTWMMLFIGCKAKTPQSVQTIAQLAVFPLLFGSSIFAPTDTMPGWLQSFVKVNPLTNATDAARSLMVHGYGGATHAVLYTLAWSLALTVVFGPLSVRSYKRRS